MDSHITDSILKSRYSPFKNFSLNKIMIFVAIKLSKELGLSKAKNRLSKAKKLGLSKAKEFEE
jgi:hypothetical protein